MRTTSAERMKIYRDRKRLGMRPVRIILADQEIDFLWRTAISYRG
jgi:hypothetical protein